MAIKSVLFEMILQIVKSFNIAPFCISELRADNFDLKTHITNEMKKGAYVVIAFGQSCDIVHVSTLRSVSVANSFEEWFKGIPGVQIHCQTDGSLYHYFTFCPDDCAMEPL